ncbi:hypothetical protein GC105_07590 [Alkalibaculum sp. M08DMB]|uniref:Uroporphyrinogen decarboxylase (URO-D) domain-containing protein n=1 Tax=Alkalibaculum sporogenes TaxID=2655001 RepID=A0A6A7K879_9FIRM|nr:uroporphyrinogen decarboxylase family protein [Alkalibaculum sporogenes]MPW25650.1 hypothetical protein [Alkalibaculum sporogenes]
MGNLEVQEKNQLFIDQWEGRVPKRVPVVQQVDTACAIELKGYSLVREQYNPEKVLEAIDYTTSQIDSDITPVSMSQNPVYLRIMGSHKFKTGSDGYIQHANESFMNADEYKEYSKDIYLFNATKGVDRSFDNITLTGNKDISAIQNATVLLKGLFAQQNYNEVFFPGRQAIVEKYNRSTCNLFDGIGCAPFDTLADFNRSFTKVLNDIRRRPQEVLEAVEALTEYEIQRVDRSVPGSRVFFALHMATFMRPKDVEKFFWPSFMEVVKHVKNTGRGIYVFCEDNWDPYMDMVAELPEEAVIRFEKTNHKLAREKCGMKNIFTGFFPMEVYRSGTVEDAINTTKKFLDEVAPGGKYQFMADKSPLRGKDVILENIKAVIKTVKEYGVY